MKRPDHRGVLFDDVRSWSSRSTCVLRVMFGALYTQHTRQVEKTKNRKKERRQDHLDVRVAITLDGAVAAVTAGTGGTSA